MISGLRRISGGAVAAFLTASAVFAEGIGADNADNDPYASDNTFMPGQNGGKGFTGWVTLETGTPGSMYLEQGAPLDGNQSWGLSGTYALGRGLATSADEGTWTFTAMHGAGLGFFSGFNLRTSTLADSFAQSEILRFGLDVSQEGDASRIYYSTNAGGVCSYLDLGDDDLRGAVLEYSVEWSITLGFFTLGVRNVDAATFSEVTSALVSGTAVAMLGTGIFEATTDERMTFDGYGLDAIPEPGTSLSVFLGAWLLLSARRPRS